jgi:hypothetical protein
VCVDDKCALAATAALWINRRAAWAIGTLQQMKHCANDNIGHSMCSLSKFGLAGTGTVSVLVL